MELRTTAAVDQLTGLVQVRLGWSSLSLWSAANFNSRVLSQSCDGSFLCDALLQACLGRRMRVNWRVSLWRRY